MLIMPKFQNIISLFVFVNPHQKIFFFFIAFQRLEGREGSRERRRGKKEKKINMGDILTGCLPQQLSYIPLTGN